MNNLDTYVKLLILGVLIVVGLQIFNQCTAEKTDVSVIEAEIIELKNQIELLENSVIAGIDSLASIERETVIYKLYYQIKDEKIDSIQSDDSLISFIRGQLQYLGSSEF